MMKFFFLALGIVGGIAFGSEDNVVRIGSKKFTENIILGDLAAHLIRDSGRSAVHVRELGGTRILWNALKKGDIDLYPEYTGTISHEIFAGRAQSLQEMAALLAREGIAMSSSLGFNNTYAIGVRSEIAETLQLKTISDLMRHRHLRFGFTSEFMERGDGWNGLKARYGLTPDSVTGLDHDLAYRGVESGSLDVIDLYATDAEIRYYDLVTLRDNLNYFPNYHAVYLYRLDSVGKDPNILKRLRRLEGAIDEKDMAALNARVKFEGVRAKATAAQFLNERFGFDIEVKQEGMWSELLKHSKNHLLLVAASLGAAIAVALPLGILAAKNAMFARLVLASTGVLQTIPSLALLVFMIPLLGIGTLPAMCALFLYSLLPIVRNTYQGIISIPGYLSETSLALGLTPFARLWKIELPLAAGAIFAGIKTAAVINIGTATLGALVGAGGFGQPILTGIRLDDIELILLGAVPAALLALGVQVMFDFAERWLVPRGLRPKSE